jgi:hypothetical protein
MKPGKLAKKTERLNKKNPVSMDDYGNVAGYKSGPSLQSLLLKTQTHYDILDYDRSRLLSRDEYKSKLGKANLPAPAKQFFAMRHENLVLETENDPRRYCMDHKDSTGNVMAELWGTHVKHIVLYA